MENLAVRFSFLVEILDFALLYKPTVSINRTIKTDFQVVFGRNIKNLQCFWFLVETLNYSGYSLQGRLPLLDSKSVPV